jgi:hypothetical protein
MAGRAATYSFLDIFAAINGPGGAFSLSQNGNSEEGITISMVEDKNTMTIGADGTAMHSLHAGKGAVLTVHLLKTSPLNFKLSMMYAEQTSSSTAHGQNHITITNPITGDSVTCRGCAFKKLPDNVNAKIGGKNDWPFDVGFVDQELAGMLAAIGGFGIF